MKLRKDKWEKVKFGDFVNHIEKTETNPEKRQNARYVSVEHIESGNFKIKNWFEVEMPTFFRIFHKGQILFGKRRAYQKKVAIADFDGICSPHIWALNVKNANLYQDFLPYLMLSDNFYSYVNANSAGTMSPYLKWPQLSNFEFSLPLLSEQKQIAALFQSIETAMEQVEGQEKNLKSLRKSLINKLKRLKPEFGNLLTKANCKAFSIGDLAVEVPDRTDNPQKSGIDKFIGLEDFETGELTIQKFSSTEKLVSSMKLCKEGDVLFARRNAYLKRASITEFDAVCSGDVIVMRANQQIILPKFLILIMNTDEFWEFAMSNAAGTMSKRVKWRDLATYTVELPDLKIQAKILGIFNQLELTLSHLKHQKSTLKQLKQHLLNEILG